MRKYLDIFSNFSDSVIIFNPETNEKIYFNNSAYTKLGYTKQEFEKINITDIMDSSNLDISKKYHNAVMKGEELNFSTRHNKKDGSYQYADIKLIPFNFNNNKYICAIWNDVSSQYESKQEQQQKDNRLISFLEILDKLTNSKAYKVGNIKDYLWDVVEEVSKVLDIDRVSIRFYTENSKELVSLAMYDKIKKKQLDGKTLTQEEYPDFFDYLKHHSMIKIDNIRSSEALEKMIQVFFSQDGMINSLLASKIYDGNQITGFIFFQSKRQIDWERDNILFANQIASNISMMMANARLIEQNIRLEAIVESRTSELKYQMEVSEKANQAKSQFLSNISHEIRTPLNAILGFISLVDRNKINAELRNYFERIELGAHQLHDIINDVLDMAKIESGKVMIYPKMMNLDQLFNEIIKTFEAQFMKKKLVLKVENRLINKLYFLDEIRIRQILNNLISNAIKFTHKGEIHIALHEEIIDSNTSNLVFIVKDTGIGIKVEDQSKLFHAFEQLDQTGTKSYQGTGLGLAITKALVNEMKGTITYESHVGKGTTFYVRITAEHNDHHTIEHFEQDAEIFGPKNYKFKNVLIVDDNSMNQEFIHDTFEPYAKHIDLASNGFETLKSVEKMRYDLVIMDIHMPIISGYQTSRLIRMNPNNETTKIIALSADALDEKIKNYELYGIDAYLVKPISSKQLLMNCEKVFEKSKSDIEYNQVTNLNDIFTNDLGFDYESAMRYMGNKQDLYIKLLNQFLKIHKNDMATLDNYLIQNEIENAKRLAHNLKGVLKTLGLTQLDSLVIDFESNLIKSGVNEVNYQSFKQLEKGFEEARFIISYIMKYL